MTDLVQFEFCEKELLSGKKVMEEKDYISMSIVVISPFQL